MRKKLTRNSFKNLRETAIVLDEDYQRKIQGGCTSDDHGIGYTDSNGNYHWTRTSDCNSNCSPSGSYGSSSGYNNGSYYGSSSDYYGSSYPSSSSAYGTSENPVLQSDYWKLSDADRWYGGYVEGLGYVAGDSIVTGSYYGSSSDYNYGSSNYDNGSSGYGSSSSFNYWTYLYGSANTGSYDYNYSSGGGSGGGSDNNSDSNSNHYYNDFIFPPKGELSQLSGTGTCVAECVLQGLRNLGITNYASTNEVMSEIGRALGLTESEIATKMLQGFNMAEQEKILSHFFNATRATSDKPITQLIQEGYLIVATVKAGHQIIITGYTEENGKTKFSYWDPEDNRRINTIDSSNITPGMNYAIDKK